jgi:4-hydroxy-2-oxoheptanedioate aldolase
VIANVVKTRWNAGEAIVGGWCSTGNSFLAEIVARESDFVLLDAQHGLFGRDSLAQCVIAVEGRGSAPLVRVPHNEDAAIGWALDIGAHGVIVPMVETAADAARAVSACRYAPAGSRSFGPMRASLRLGRDVNDLVAGIVCLVMIETGLGVENVKEIVKVPGVDGVFVGPSDLAISLGVGPSMTPVAGVHAEALRRVETVCLEAGIGLGIPCADADLARQRMDDGYNLVTIGSDVQWVSAAARTQLQIFRHK